MEDESKGKLKRTRAPSNGAQVPSCLVDGCDSDLRKCRDYHRRHKVCELHSKTPKVKIAGQEQRFCQQCSRFHSLVEFDEGKRSCRKRLDGHNRRRRKPQPESTSTDSGKFISTYQGTRVLPFHSPHMFSSTVMSSALAASGAVKAENDLILYNSNSQLSGTRKQLFPASVTQIYKGEKQLSLLQGTDCSNFPEASVCQPLHDADPATQKVFSSWLYRDVDPDCALSLLSSTPTDTKEIGLSHIMQSNQTPMAQSLIPSLHYNDLEMVGAPTNSILGTHGGSNANLHYQEMYRINKPDGSSSSGSHQALSFSWE